MRVTLTFDGQSPQEQVVVLRQPEKPAQAQLQRPVSPFPYSLLERGTMALLLGLDRLARWLVCAWFR